MSLLEIAGLGKRYGRVSALKGIDLVVPASSRTAIVGPSGSGKTTLLRLIAGFEAPDEGRIALGGRVIADGGAAMPAHLRGIGFVPQDGALFPHLDVAGNIGFGLDRGLPDRAGRIAGLMAMVELEQAMLVRRPHELSGGQQQRVALARALARQPALMLLDEPFSALDAGLRDSTRKAVARLLQQAGITAILVTHDQAEALSFADQVAVIQGGRLAQVGSPRELYLHPADPATAAFLGDAIILPAMLGDGWADCALGSIAAETGARRGPAQIMLRPEQVRLTTSPEGVAGHGQVTEIDFGGAICSVAVALHGYSKEAARPTMPLVVRCSSTDLPPVGCDIRIAVTGRAHVFT